MIKFSGTSAVGRAFLKALLVYVLILQGFLVSNLAAAELSPQGQVLCLTSTDHALSGQNAPDQTHVDCSCPGLCAQVLAFAAPDLAAVTLVRRADTVEYSIAATALHIEKPESAAFQARGPPQRA